MDLEKLFLDKNVKNFLEMFSEENIEVRDELASILPSYNELLNMRCRTFEEFALLPIAKKQGRAIHDQLFTYDDILPICPKCGKDDKVRKTEPNLYKCEKCNIKFAANWKSLSSGSRYDAVVWNKVLHCMLECYTVDRTCDYCKISRKTFYKMRNKWFYAMMKYMGRVKLFGEIQIDNTFEHVSYKGSDLDDPDFPEDSIFDDKTFIPRESRKRGGPYSYRERGISDVCIVAVADKSGHVLTRFVGIGSANGQLLYNALGNDKILLTVPKKDPFPIKNKSKKKNIATLPPGSPSFLVSDGERAISSFAKKLGITHEKHVYRRKGKQMKLPKGAHDIQLANNVHARLKKFLRDTNYVSSKYLPGFLVMFEFMQNTNCSQDAIAELFCILAEPGCERSDEFFEGLFSVPNYMVQWAAEDNPLKKFRYNQILAYYLYDKRQESLQNGKVPEMTVAEIAETCEITEKSVRRNYKNLKASNYDSIIKEYFGDINASQLREKGVNIPKKRKRKVDHPIYLAIYDEYAENRKRDPTERLTLAQFTEYANKKYDLELTDKRLEGIFAQIKHHGLRPPMPQLKKKEKKEKQVSILGFEHQSPSEKGNILMYFELQELKKEYRRKNIKLPTRDQMCAELAVKHGLTQERVTYMVTHLPTGAAKRYRNRPEILQEWRDAGFGK